MVQLLKACSHFISGRFVISLIKIHLVLEHPAYFDQRIGLLLVSSMLEYVLTYGAFIATYDGCVVHPLVVLKLLSYVT